MVRICVRQVRALEHLSRALTAHIKMYGIRHINRTFGPHVIAKDWPYKPYVDAHNENSNRPLIGIPNTVHIWLSHSGTCNPRWL